MTPVMPLVRAADQAAVGRGQWGMRNGLTWVSCWGCRIPVPQPLPAALVEAARPSGRDRVTEGAWACEEQACGVAARLRLLDYYADAGGPNA
jgi:hypothetical protein